MGKKSIVVVVQAYWPDTVSSAQHVTDLCEELARQGHRVRVVCGRHAYDADEKYKAHDVRSGVEIIRVGHTKFGKGSVFRRLADFFVLNCSLFINLLFIRGSVDEVLALTSPPLSGFIALKFAQWKRGKLTYWVMDLQPELSIASGLMKEGALTTRIFRVFGEYLIRRADKIISMDRHMSKYLVRKGADISKILEAPVWPVSTQFFKGARDENPFRIKNCFQDRLVVMYSGNHAFVHPLDTLLSAASTLSAEKAIHFAFVGGGVRATDVSTHIARHKLNNISQHEFQPRETFHISIASSDLQVVVLGDGQVGYTHPNKIYGAMLFARPVLFVGPSPSHCSDILDQVSGNISVAHGDVDGLVRQLLLFAQKTQAERDEIGRVNRRFALMHFDSRALIAKHASHLLS